MILLQFYLITENYRDYNSFKSAGMKKIAKALQNMSTLTIFSISNNNVDEQAAGDIATVLSHNTNLRKLYLNSNNFKTEGMIKIAEGLQNISTLRILNISSNNIGKGAADNIAAEQFYLITFNCDRCTLIIIMT